MDVRPHCGVLGGTRSGKSRFAQDLAWQVGQERVLFVATATVSDEEMAARIARHQRDRPGMWLTWEAPLDLEDPLTRHPHYPVVLIDCLSLWVANHLLGAAEGEDLEEHLTQHLDRVFALAQAQNQTLILVSNEVGLGVVPAYPLGRQYRDLLGWVNQKMTHHCAEVYWLLAGIPMRIKPPSPPPQR
jgi:adenosyl cobinamide kinase/adenosyl cobinamide phosphate guanylyltransferase